MLMRLQAVVHREVSDNDNGDVTWISCRKIQDKMIKFEERLREE